MLSLRTLALRYSFWIFTVGFVLSVPSISIGQNANNSNTNNSNTNNSNTNNSNTQQTPVQPATTIEKMEQTQVARGGSVTFTGQNFPPRENITVFLNGIEQKGKVVLVSEDKTSFIFAVPDDIGLGTYSVRVDFLINNVPVPFTPISPEDAKLTIFSASGNTTPKIIAVSPLISYPDKEIYGFEVIGEGFSKKSKDNGLIYENHGEIKVCWEKNGKQEDEQCLKDDAKAVRGEVINDRQLKFSGVSQEKQQINKIRIRVGQNYSEPFEVTLSRVGKNIPAIVSAVVFVLLFGIVLYVTLSGIKTHEVAGQPTSLLTALFLDKETDTYSLSRFQFFIWTAAAIFTYLYLLLSRSLVQWELEFVDVPTGLPAIILISASTTVLAQGINNSKGPKGSGAIHPSVADFISVGGIVVPERFQFFVWTLLGVAVFIFLVLLNDPGTINSLPDVPSGFLQLMGVSSLGYLGGKLARKPGPVIDEITATLSSLELTIRGRILSSDASFQIGSNDIKSDNIEGGKPIIVDADTQSGEPNMAKVLKLKIKNPAQEWLEGNPELTIINPDGQKSVWAYEGLLKIDSTADKNTFTFKPVKYTVPPLVELQDEKGVTLETPSLVNLVAPDTLVIEVASTVKAGNIKITNPTDNSVTVIPFKIE